MGATMIRNLMNEDAIADPQASDQLEDLRSLLARVLPVWRTQVGSVQSQTEAAITRLLVSFASITEQFEAAGFKGAGGAPSDAANATIPLLTLCERELRPVISSMTAPCARSSSTVR
jgi:methyl-accepting chemotaxis protein